MNIFNDAKLRLVRSLGCKLYLLSTSWLFLSNCSSPGYRQDSTLTDRNGIPVNSSILFVPDSMITDGGIVPSNLNEDRYLYSAVLSAAKQPILFNYFVNETNTYRFTYIPSFHLPVIISFLNNGDDYWITTTVLDRHPRSMIEVKGHWKYPLSFLPGDSASKHNKDNEFITDSIIQPDRFALIKSTTKRQLTSKEWLKFNRMVDEAGFWQITPYQESTGFDGANWLLEGSNANKYWAVGRWSPKGRFKELGEFLVSMSQLPITLY
jgi:hypothetical protein